MVSIKNWNSDAEWTVSAELTTSSIDANINNNSATAKFKLDVPDLEVSISRVSAVEPLSGVESDNYVPNTNYIVEGTVTNNSNVSTQPGIYIPVTAKLIPVNSSGIRYGEEVDSETVLLPMEDQFETSLRMLPGILKLKTFFYPLMRVEIMWSQSR